MFRMNEIYGSCTDEFILAAEGSQYWCPAYEHTRGLIWLSNSNNLLIPNFLLGIGQTGIFVIFRSSDTLYISNFW